LWVIKPKKKLRGRAKLLVVQAGDQPGPSDSSHTPSGEEEGFVRAPATPIHLLQRIGRQLGIDENKLTKEKLEATPDDSDKRKSVDV
jgi:hypothetical protein